MISCATIKDEELVLMAKDGNDVALEYILNKYKNYVRAKSRTYFLIGADREDLIQEGMIGLYKAVRDYNEEKCSSFKKFAEICITRQIISAVKAATRQKHIPLNSYVSLNKPMYEDGSDKTLYDILAEERMYDPEELMVHKEETQGIGEQIEKVLSKLEQRVLSLYLNGKSYQEIARELHRHVKSIDNALQRVKRKLEKSLDELAQKG